MAIKDLPDSPDLWSDTLKQVAGRACGAGTPNDNLDWRRVNRSGDDLFQTVGQAAGQGPTQPIAPPMRQ